MLVAINTFGLLFGLGGVVLLFRYGMPYRLRTNGKTTKTVLLPNADDTVRVERKYDRLGWLGLSLIVLGTVCQIYVGIVTLYPASNG